MFGTFKATSMTAAAIGLIAAVSASRAQAQSAGGQDAEIALLKQQLKLMEQKLDHLQKQTSANTNAAAHASAKGDAAKTKAPRVEPRLASLGGSNANAAYPVKGPGIIPDAVVHMPNNRPTICTLD